MINCHNCINWVDEDLQQIGNEGDGLPHIFMGCRIYGYIEQPEMEDCPHYVESDNLFSICGKCKIRIEDEEENWVKLGNRGTLLVAYHVTGAREVDPSTGWHPDGQVFNPMGFIRPDGGNEWTLLVHVMEEPDTKNLKPGTRVEPVWRPRGERRGTMQDIKFWRIVKE